MAELVDARDAAEAANELKSQFLANMSHEIRTPLNGLLAMSQVMAMEDLTRSSASACDVIRKSGQALLAILNDVLDVSKIEAGKLELEHRRVRRRGGGQERLRRLRRRRRAQGARP